jgi:hypothetical protein
VSFVAITLCVASQRVFVLYFVIDVVRKLLDMPSYNFVHLPVISFSVGLNILMTLGSRDSSVGIGLGYGLDDRGSAV